MACIYVWYGRGNTCGDGLLAPARVLHYIMRYWQCRVSYIDMQ